MRHHYYDIQKKDLKQFKSSPENKNKKAEIQKKVNSAKHKIPNHVWSFLGT